MLKLGGKALGWLGFVLGLATFAAEQRDVVGDVVADAGRLVAIVAAALGGAVIRPQHQRETDK